jgi:hypothetical protein
VRLVIAPHSFFESEPKQVLREALRRGGAPGDVRVVERECAPRLCPSGRPRRRAVLLLESVESLSDKFIELVRRLARDWGWDVRRPNSFKQREARR